MRTIQTGAVLLVFLTSSAVARAGESLLESDVLPILTKNCLGCHGGLRQKGGLDLRTVAAMRRGGKSGPAVKAGDVESSELWARVESDQMPPGDRKLSAFRRVTGLEHPAIGCIASHQLGTPESDMPAFVTIDAGYDLRVDGGRLYRSVPAYLGPKHTPLAVNDPTRGLENLRPPGGDRQLETDARKRHEELQAAPSK